MLAFRDHSRSAEEMLRGRTTKRSHWLGVSLFWITCLSVSLVGCHDLTDNQSLPSGIEDPSYYDNATGAIGMRNAAVFTFGNSLIDYIIQTGLITDELSNLNAVAGPIGGNIGTALDPLDERILPELSPGDSRTYASDKTYASLQGTRTALLQAIGQLAVYDTSAKDTAVLKPAAGRALRGELYALYGYIEIMLANFFCSGVPLSTLDFQHDITYRAGTTTRGIYQDAIAKLDTAFALSSDSSRIQNLARIGLGRAYLNVGNYAAAADDVSHVPTDFLYQMTEFWSQSQANGLTALVNDAATISNREGGNGIPYTSMGDPRTLDTAYDYYRVDQGKTIRVTMPWRYKAGLTGAAVPIIVASGIEARLIEAEVTERVNNSAWLAILNTLRTTGAVAQTYIRLCRNGIETDGVVMQVGSPCRDVTKGPTGTVDTTWSPGTGIGLIPADVQADVGPICSASEFPGTPCTDTVWYRGLRPLTDPGATLTGKAADSSRLALIFRERAAWLFLTGNRQGDLRRQIREYSQYWRSSAYNYPSGAYPGLVGMSYGNDLTAPIPAAEYLNPLFKGCLSRDP